MLNKEDSFFKDTFILTLSNLTTGIIGFIFLVLLSRKLGAEGMGLYGLVMPIYNLFICLICGGMTTAISKNSAVYLAQNNFGDLKKSTNMCLFFDLIFGIIIASLVFTSSKFIGHFIIRDLRTENALKIICPAMVFVALSSILKGFFYGISKVNIPAIIDIIEKSMRILVLLTVMNMITFHSIKNNVTAGYSALTFGELTSLILLYTAYRIHMGRFKVKRNAKKSETIQLLFNVLVISIPLCLNGFLSTIISATSALIVPRRLISAGLSYKESLSLIGKYTGMALNITSFPMLIVNSIGIILVPDLSKNLSQKNFFAVEDRIKKVIDVSFSLGLATFAICMSIPNNLGSIIYGRNDLQNYIYLAAIPAPIMYINFVSFSILNGLSKQGTVLKNSLIASFTELFILYTLTGIPKINIYGYGVDMLITPLLSFSLNMHEIKKSIDINFSASHVITNIVIAVFVMLTLIIFNNFFNSISAINCIIEVVFGYTEFFLLSNFFAKLN